MNLKKFKPSPAVRLWIYGMGIAVAPLLVWYGVAQKEEVALWLAVLYTALGFGLASINVNKDNQ